MKRDPFYRQIVERLGGELDPDTFEGCVADLLQDIYPGLVPIHGGKDAGMDGAISDREGEPFPLVATTEENVISNFTKSLNSYVQAGRKRREVVLATSQYLTPRRIQNLYDRSAVLGFTLVNVHSRDDIANRLYHSPEWCLELLNLPGKPPALSLFPKSDRPLINKTLMGREKELAWLLETEGDRLLIGQPGSGKSFLLHQFALEGGGLFVVEENRGEIAAGIRSQQPSVLIVDDAQVNLPLLKDLKQMRQELGVEFSILASCWHGDEDKVAQTMNLSEQSIHHLDLLTRSQIVEVVKDTGLGGPTELLREIVSQAEGRPGLAATLAHLCLHGGVKEVILGDALSASVRKFFKPRLGSKAIDVLASFSVGGDVGMTLPAVSDGLQMKVTEVREIAVELAAGGIIWETGKDSLSVQPPALRHSLVRDVFFQGAFSLSIQPFIDQSSDLVQTAHTLVGAYARGANIPDSLLRNLLERANSVEVWEHYAWQGPIEAGWVLENYPGLLVSLAHPALKHVPEIVIPRLLQAAVGDNRQLHATPKHPLRMIDDWVKSAWPGKGEAVVRREILIRIVCSWFDRGKDATIGLKALISAFSPICGDITTDPGAGNTVTIRQTYLLLDEMRSVQMYWPEIYAIVRGMNIITWQPLQEIVKAWAFTHLYNIKISDEVRNLVRSFAVQILSDIVTLAREHPGILHWAGQVSLDARFDISIPLDREFEILYPIEERLNWHDAEAKHRPIVQALAREWVSKSPQNIAEKMAWIEREAQSAETKWPRWTTYLCSEMSHAVESPVTWARALIKEGCDGDLILPFLRNSVEVGEQGWRDLIGECLSQAGLKGVTISIIMTMKDPPEELLAEVLGSLSGYDQLIDTLCVRGEIPEKTVRRLLLHEDPTIAGAAAQGEWYANPKGKVRESIKTEWRNALARSRQEHFISVVLVNDSELAYDWLMNFLQDEVSDTYKYERALRAAFSALDLEAKKSIMEIIPPNLSYGELVHNLIGNDLELYGLLLNETRLQLFHLVPLTWQDRETWVEKAKLALKAGYSTNDIAHAAYGFPIRSISWTGKESLVRKEWLERFESLCSHEDERIRAIGAVGKAEAEAEFQEALREERDEDIFGFRAVRRRSRYIS